MKACKHYKPNRGKPMCAKGVDIRKHVGGPMLGWLSRIPCITEGGFIRPDEVVPCAQLDLPTKEEADAAQAKFMRDVDIIMSGKCPTCGAKLVVRENNDARVSVCPCGESSMRECKRIGEHLP